MKPPRATQVKVELLVELARDRASSLVTAQSEGLLTHRAGSSKRAARWDEVVLFKHHVVPANVTKRFPKTLAAIRKAETDAGVEAGAFFFNAKFSILHPGSKILPHCGPSNARLRTHVALAGVKGATLRVATEKRRKWVEGDALVFDDSFEHDVSHKGDAPRILLLLDFWHPDLPTSDRDFSKYGHAFHS